MAGCGGYCRYGSVSWGNDPLAYSGLRCGCQKCPNFEFCQEWGSPSVYALLHNGRCGNCNMNFRKDLTFRDSRPGDECPICLDRGPRFVEHPSGCGHAVCLECFALQWKYPEPNPIAPEAYGFRSLCEAPWYTCTATLCACKLSMSLWKLSHPAKHQQWVEAEDALDAAYERSIAERADPARCPVCRKDVGQAHGNSWYLHGERAAT